MSEGDLEWLEGGENRRARWQSESAAPPKKIVLADDGTRADAAFRLAAEGTALIYEGDYQNARQLLAAITHRVKPPKQTGELAHDFHLYRQARGRCAQIAGRLLVPVNADLSIPLRRAPDLREALSEAWGAFDGPRVAPLREVLGAVGAHEWRKKGVPVPALNGRVHPHYGAFAPIRGEYVGLVANAPLGGAREAWDVGTGTGVLALVLAQRGVPRVVATDIDPRVLDCARENVKRFGLQAQIDVREADLWPEGKAELIVCNPPWLPGRPTSRLERAIYDPDSSFLTRFIAELPAHLTPGGEGWLVLSDLAERLGLRPPGWLEQSFERAGLRVLGVSRTAAAHPRARDASDVFHAARAAEQTALYRLGRA